MAVRPPTVVAIVPARDEPAIAATITSLRQQTVPPDLICVVANNCTPGDTTAQDARQAGAYVIDLPHHPGRKAGAINTALTGLDCYLDDNAVIVVMDADSVLAPDWIERALPLVPAHGGVSGAFEAIRLPGWISLIQRAEYAQARHRITQRGGAVNVLSGAATALNMGLLRRVRNSRSRRHPLTAAGWGTLPGTPGQWYDEASLTEDYELTLAVKQLGAEPVSPPGLRVDTDVMRGVRDLWRQRIRWQTGYLTDTRHYPLAQTWRAWLVQVWVYASALAVPLMAVLVGYAVATNTFTWSPVWLAVTPLFAASEAWSARRAGPAGVLLAACVVPLWVYALWRSSAYYAAAGRALRSGVATAVWH